MRKIPGLWLMPAILAVGCAPLEAPEGRAERPAVAAPGAALEAESVGIQPRGQKAAEMRKAWAYGWDKDAAHGSAVAVAWDCDPELFGFQEDPGGAYALPSESQSSTGLLVGWPQWGCAMYEVRELVRAALGHTDVTIIVPAQFQELATACLRREGVPADDLDLINWVNLPVDSVWIRDYGPETVLNAAGERRFVDASYYPNYSKTCRNLIGRDESDALPTRLADLWQVPVYRPTAVFEGGNVLADGAGRCFRMRRGANLLNWYVFAVLFGDDRWDPDGHRLDEVLGAAYGCEVHSLESLTPGVIDHIDMTVAFLSPDTVLVGRYDEADDPENGAILDRNAAYLEGLGYRVVRIPMPTPWCARVPNGCYADERAFEPCGDPAAERVWATYTNSIRVGDRMIVPVYHWAPESMRDHVAAQEAEALAIYRAELDRLYGAGAVEVVPIRSDAIIPCAGTFHCISMTYR